MQRGRPDFPAEHIERHALRAVVIVCRAIRRCTAAVSADSMQPTCMLQAPRAAPRAAVIVAGTSRKGFGKTTQTRPVPAKVLRWHVPADVTAADHPLLDRMRRVGALPACMCAQLVASFLGCIPDHLEYNHLPDIRIGNLAAARQQEGGNRSSSRTKSSSGHSPQAPHHCSR